MTTEIGSMCCFLLYFLNELAIIGVVKWISNYFHEVSFMGPEPIRVQRGSINVKCNNSELFLQLNLEL